MKIKRFNESNSNFKLYFKKYKCDDYNIKILYKDINDLIDSGNLLYDLYYYEEGNSWNFLLYAYVNESFYNFYNLNTFEISILYTDLRELRNEIFTSNYKKITKEDINDIYISTMANKFNI